MTLPFISSQILLTCPCSLDKLSEALQHTGAWPGITTCSFNMYRSLYSLGQKKEFNCVVPLQYQANLKNNEESNNALKKLETCKYRDPWERALGVRVDIKAQHMVYRCKLCFKPTVSVHTETRRDSIMISCITIVNYNHNKCKLCFR